MDASKVLQRYAEIERPNKKDFLNLATLKENLSLAVTHEGEPGLFFQLKTQTGNDFARSMKSLDLRCSDDFRVGTPEAGYQRSAGYLIKLCAPSETWRFATIACDLAWNLGADQEAFASANSIDEFITEWADLFACNQMRREDSIGLWGELWTLSRFALCDRGVACWTGPLRTPFDFTGNGLRLEVKTSIGTSVARFGAEQLSSPKDAFTLFVRTSEDPIDGLNLDDLVEFISKSLTSNTRFYGLLGRVGYFPGANADLRLDVEEALLLRNEQIPIPMSSDPRVRSIRFSVSIDDFREEIKPVEDIVSRLSKTGG